MDRCTSSRGFTLIELLIVVAIIGIVAAIAIPGLMRARVFANEGSAIGSIRAINSGQATYAASAAGGGYATSLAILGTACPGNNQAFVSPDLGGAVGGVKSGYTIVVTGVAGVAPTPADCNGTATTAGYYSSATPVQVGATGGRAFASNQAMTIYFLNNGVAPVDPGGFIAANALQ